MPKLSPPGVSLGVIRKPSARLHKEPLESSTPGMVFMLQKKHVRLRLEISDLTEKRSYWVSCIYSLSIYYILGSISSLLM